MPTYFNNKYQSAMDSKYYVPQSAVGAPTSVQTANQLAEATARLNAGVEGVEIGAVNQETFQSIPEQHFDEIRRLTKLTDAKASLHAPITDPAGFGKEKWSEFQREQNEREIQDSIDKAYKLDPTGNTTVVVHASGGVPAEITKKLPSGEERKEMMIAVNQDTGQLIPLEYEKKRYIGREKIWTPEERLKNLNITQWDQEKLQLMELLKRKSEVEDRRNGILQSKEFQELAEVEQKGALPQELREKFKKYVQEVGLLQSHKDEIDQHIGSQMEELHHKFQEYFSGGEEKKREVFREINNFEESARIYGEQQKIFREIAKRYEDTLHVARAEDIQNIRERINKEAESEIKRRLGRKVDEDEILASISQLPPPEIFKPVNEFAKEKTSETVSNVAINAYDRFGENTPIIAIENWNPEMAHGRGESLKELVQETRRKFVEKLQKKGIAKEKAQATAEKIIGATWDVGHINLLRKYGYTEEDLRKETEKVASVVKHVHLTDNFGHNDAHLPPGMGNVPTHEHLKTLKEAGFKFEKGKLVVEAGKFVADFKQSPHLHALEELGSPLYTYKAPPYWTDIRETQAPYSTGYGEILPEQHFKSLYGGGFSTLPRELGGQVGGERSRFAGTPNQ